MPPEINRETVVRRKERLREEYGGARVREVSDELPAEEFPSFREQCREGYTGGGYAWVVRDPGAAAPLTESMPDDIDQERRALMILGRGGSNWGVPGGGREDGETYEDAAVREVREETGIDCEVTGAFLVRHLTLTAPGHEERIHTLWVFFDARYEGGHVEIQPGELNGAAWFAEPPERMYPENVVRAADFWDDYEYDGDPFEEFYGED